MSQRRSFRLVSATVSVMACLLLGSGVASAQQIGGTVSDTTGGVLPGVTVEARSPAIIEGVRTAVTDGSGQYLIIALEPGTYSITYSLPGFGTLIREGIELSQGFTATVDVQLSVGDIAETVTVSGASPVVDIQNVEQRAVMDREIIDSIPTGKSIINYGLLVPGMVGADAFGSSLAQDAGGLTARTMQRMSIHGGHPDDQMINVNGMDVSDPSLGGDMGFFPDTNFEEMAFSFAGNSAEYEAGGVNINMIPKEGANTFSGSFFTTFSFPDLLASNLDQDLMDRGVLSATELEENWTINPTFGGPIVEDRLWFFVTHTSRVADLAASGVFKTLDPSSLVYEPDLSRPAIDETTVREQSMNLTFQATARDKLKAYWSNSSTDQPHLVQGRALGAVFIAPEAAVNSVTRTNIYQLNWTRPHTNRLLFEAGVSHMPTRFANLAAPDAFSGVPGVLEVAAGLQGLRNASAWLRGAENYFAPRDVNVYNGSVSYVTGSHNLKVGIAYNTQGNVWGGTSANWTTFLTALGNPFAAQFHTGLAKEDNASGLGIYAQEQWTRDRLTVNAGVRWDRVTNSYPDQDRVTNLWITEPFLIPGQEVSVWKDFQPRLGIAYDLRGDGKTALKFAANRYGRRVSFNTAEEVNPALSNTISQRTWLDGATGHLILPPGTPPLPSCIGPVTCIPGDGIVQGDPTNFAPNGELLDSNSNLAWGLPQVTTFFDPNWAFGWGQRESDWELSGGVQQELMSGVSVDIGFFRRQTVNRSVVDNRALGPDDFDVATFVIPDDPRLPDGGGGTLSIFDLNPASVRVPDDLVTASDNFGTDTRTWQGFDFTVDARVADVLLQGGVSTGRTSFDYCDVQSAVPEAQAARTIGFATSATQTVPEDTLALEHCNRTENWLTQVKLLGSYTLPYDIQIAATLQNQPGPPRSATLLVNGADTSLGRPFVSPELRGGGVLNLLAPGSEYGERFNQLDLRLTKLLNLGGATRLRAMFDLFNVLNANAVMAENTAFGPTWLDPVIIMPGRLAKFAFQIDF